MIGQTADSVDLTPTGVVGDRTWAVRDEVRGGIRGAKKIGQLMQFTARYSSRLGGDVEITSPDGSTITSSDPDANARLSEALDHHVTLWPLQPPTDLDHYRRGAPDTDDFMAELNGIFGREDGEPLPDLSVFPPEIMEFESPPGTYLDAFPLMLMTTSALRSLQLALPESTIDTRRFRPSLVVDTSDLPGHPEFDWVGRSVSVGDVELEIITGCPRCVMVTREIANDVPVDRSLLRHIVKDLGQNVGVYARARSAGSISVGDGVVVS